FADRGGSSVEADAERLLAATTGHRVDARGEPAPQLGDPAGGRREASRPPDHLKRGPANDAGLEEMDEEVASPEGLQVEPAVEIGRQGVLMPAPEAAG